MMCRQRNKQTFRQTDKPTTPRGKFLRTHLHTKLQRHRDELLSTEAAAFESLIEFADVVAAAKACMNSSNKQ